MQFQYRALKLGYQANYILLVSYENELLELISMDNVSPRSLYWFIKIHGDLLECYTRRQFISFY